MTQRPTHALVERLLFPALMLVPAALAIAALRAGVGETWVMGTAVLGSVALQLGLELWLPYRADWRARPALGADLRWVLLALLTSQVIDRGVLVAFVAWLKAVHVAGPWPLAWPLAAQVGLAVLIADAGHYAAHRALHAVPVLWALHSVHHAPGRLYTLNFFRMHPLDILLKTLGNLLPLVVLGAPHPVIAVWTVLSGVSAGSLNHANLRLDTRGWDLFFSTPSLHRQHHSRDVAAAQSNFGNITMLYDWLFGTYRAAQPEVRAVGLDRPDEPVGTLVVNALRGRPLQELTRD